MKNILFISNLPFKGVIKQRPHYIFQYISKKVNTILIEAPIAFPWRGFYKSIKERDHLQLNSLFPYRGPLIAVNNKILLKCISKNIDLKKNYTVITSAPHLLKYKELSKLIKVDKLVYDCIDDLANLDGSRIAVLEEELMNEVDYVVTSSKRLQEKWGGLKKMIINIPNGVDYNYYTNIRMHFKDDMLADRIRDGFKTVLGYVGAIGYWFDWATVDSLLSSSVSYRIVLIGPCFTGLPKIFRRRLKYGRRFEYLGVVHFKDVPKYIKYFDYGIIPFNTNIKLVESVLPLKLFEYLAMDKPILSTIWKEIKKYEDYGVILDTRSFLKIGGYPNVDSKIRLEIAGNFSWERLVDDFLKFID